MEWIIKLIVFYRVYSLNNDLKRFETDFFGGFWQEKYTLEVDDLSLFDG